MRILKYLFLLFLLFLFGLTVFVTTQKGNYDITQSKVIKTQRGTLYNYVNDYRNWETFASWLSDDKGLEARYYGESSGKGAIYSWKGNDSEGKLQTTAAKENQSISQKMDFNASQSEVFWTFKDTLGGTKVSWRAKGKMTAMMKIKAFFQGGPAAVFNELYAKSLLSLDKILDYEINTYKIKIDGLVNRPATFFIGQTFNTYENKSVRNIKILLPKMTAFFEKNKLVTSGKPFVTHNSNSGGIFNISVNMPIADSVYIMPGSELNSGNIEAVSAIKATLTGDYSHLKEARLKAIAYLLKNGLRQNPTQITTEVYVKTQQDSKQPSKWITEIYIPVYPKTAAPARVYKPKDSTAVNVAAPAEIPENQE